MFIPPRARTNFLTRNVLLSTEAIGQARREWERSSAVFLPPFVPEE